jgi:biopolymer transport protein ExbD
MSKRHIPESHSAHPNVTPLIDVVMVLIVFFMLVAKIGVSTGADDSIKIPESILGIEIQDLGNTLTLNVKPSVANRDMPQVTALVPGPGGAPPTVTELKLDMVNNTSQLINTLRMFRFGKDLNPKGEGANADNENFQVIIRGQHDMEYRYLEMVLMACARAQVKAVNFNTSKKIAEAPVAVN